jgi:polyisoprenoid-binding protein YceI
MPIDPNLGPLLVTPSRIALSLACNLKFLCCAFGLQVWPGTNALKTEIRMSLRFKSSILALAFASAFILFVQAPLLPAFAQTSNWQIDPAHANAQFKVTHLGISKVQGEFTNVTGTVQLDEADPTKSVVNATIDTATVFTRNDSRDKDLKDNFFEVTKYPTMTFVSKSITRGADGKLQVTGDFTLHGVTKPVTFAVDGPTEAIKDPWGNQRRGASATATIHRSDFGITKYPGVIGEEIAITLDIEFIKK